MLQNIFISTSLNHTKETLNVIYHSKDIEIFISQVNAEPGFIFIYNTIEEKLYAAKIKTMSMEHPGDYEFVKINFGNHSVFIKYQLNFRSFSLDMLKYLYARLNENEIGSIDKSIFNTYQRYNFPFSRPILYEEGFQQEFGKIEELLDEKLLDENDLANHILYEGLIIPSTNNNFKTYAILVEEDGEYYLSLTNDKMLDLDMKYMSREYSQDLPLYKPYFYDFYPDKEQFQENIFSNYRDGVYEIEFVSYQDEKDNKEELIKGEVVFSASPIKSVPVYIKSLHKSKDSKVLNQLQKILSFAKNTINTEKDKIKIEQKIMRGLISNNVKLSNELTIYSVGQGNWSKIDFKNYNTQKILFSIIFDIGIGNKASKNVDEIAGNAAKEMKGNYMIMLSHWDQDHIKGIIHLKKNQFEKLWIVPRLPNGNVSQSAIRLAAFLYLDPKIECMFVDDKFNNQVIINNNYLMLGKGEGQNTNSNATRGGKQVKVSYNSNNNLGLILAIKNNDQKILLSGDCEYIQFPNAFINHKYNCLIASHHGAKTNIKSLKGIGFLDVVQNTPAIVCVGESKKYPCGNHVYMIESLGYKMEKTCELTGPSNSFHYNF